MSHDVSTPLARHRRGFNQEYIYLVRMNLRVCFLPTVVLDVLLRVVRVVRAPRACRLCRRPFSDLIYSLHPIELPITAIKLIIRGGNMTVVDQILSGHLATLYFVGSWLGAWCFHFVMSRLRPCTRTTVGAQFVLHSLRTFVFRPNAIKSILHTPFYSTPGWSSCFP